MAPKQVTEQTVPEVSDKLYGQCLDQKTPPPKCQVGDRVRLNKKHRPFKKGYLPGWTEDVVTHIRRHLVVTYQLSEWDRTPIKGTFYRPDVQKVQVFGQLIISCGKTLETKRAERVSAVERVAVQARQLVSSPTSWSDKNKTPSVKNFSGGKN